MAFTPELSAECVQIDTHREGLGRLEYSGDRSAVLIAKGASKMARDQRYRGLGVNDPVRGDSCVGVLASLDQVVGSSRSWRDDLHHQDCARRTQQPARFGDPIEF